MKEVRARGRPRQGWRDGKEEDVQEVDVTSWRERIRNKGGMGGHTLSAAVSLNGQNAEEEEEEKM